RDPLAAVAGGVSGRRLLLLLDNCEHVLEAAAALCETAIEAGAAVRILATSREALSVPGEVVRRLRPLSVPDDGEGPDGLAQSPAVRLFVDRARAAGAPETDLADVAQIAQVCRELDGIPLAIELAAARVPFLGVRGLLDRLDDRFRVLTSGRRTRVPHHQTLRAAIDWSDRLLDETERLLFARLSVFSASFDLEAAEAVCGWGGIAADDVLDVLGRLVDRSLVTVMASGGQVRYRLLDTIRRYARERLEEVGETRPMRRRHAEYHRELARQGALALRGSAQLQWRDRLTAVTDDLRAALAWAGSNGDGELLLELAAGLWDFWVRFGHLLEGHRWVTVALEACPDGPVDLRATALAQAALSSWWLGDLEGADRRAGESLVLRGEETGAVSAAFALQVAGIVAAWRGDPDGAGDRFARSADLFRAAGDSWGVASALNRMEELARKGGDVERAAELAAESLALYEELGDPWGTGWSRWALGRAAATLGRGEEADEHFRAGLRLSAEIGHLTGIAFSLLGLAETSAHTGDWERAVRLHGAADGLATFIGAPLGAPVWHGASSFDPDAARQQLGEPAFEAAWQEGRGLSAEAAVALALGASRSVG
ncbi:MAG: ATP-binding protein, partial [Nitriliruptorales bacterium]